MKIDTEPVVIVGGGQSGLAAARAVRDQGLRPLVLEAGDRPTGSWPDYYDSLTLFSPARFSALPGMPFPGNPDRYPVRDEVVDYLQRYADSLDVEIRTGTRVESVRTVDGGGFSVATKSGESIRAAGVVAASGSFGNPYLPFLPGQQDFGGRLLHVADYRGPGQFAGQRVVVVGAGNSAVQVGYELARVASVTLATNNPVQFLAQRTGGRDVHHWLAETGFDDLPLEWLVHFVGATLVLDAGRYQQALESGVLERRPMFRGFDGDRVVWADGTAERVDAVVFATGYRPNLGYLESLGAVEQGVPRHVGGISATHPGLAYVGLEFQRSFSSNTLRGVHRDAQHVVAAVAAFARRAPAAVGL